jgi:hypothetical protein
MTKYELIAQNREKVYEFAKAGILPFQSITHLNIYERRQVLEKTKHPTPTKQIVKEFGYSRGRVKRIIQEMNEEV